MALSVSLESLPDLFCKLYSGASQAILANDDDSTLPEYLNGMRCVSAATKIDIEISERPVCLTVEMKVSQKKPKACLSAWISVSIRPSNDEKVNAVILNFFRECTYFDRVVVCGTTVAGK